MRGKIPAKAVRRGGFAVSAAVAAALAAVYANEGGYVNHPNDPGGATNYGVTEQVARQNGYIGDMRHFPKHCAGVLPAKVCADKIYVEKYIEQPGLAPMFEISPPVATELFDTLVNMGPGRPSRWFQQSLNDLGGAGLKVDGQIGPKTIGAYVNLQKRFGPRYACVATVRSLDAKQLAEYDRLVRVNRRLKVFYRGWVNHRIGNVDTRECR